MFCLEAIIANITAAVPMSAEVRKIVVALIEGGATAGAIVALLGGGGLIAYIVKKAFKSKIKKVIIVA